MKKTNTRDRCVPDRSGWFVASMAKKGGKGKGKGKAPPPLPPTLAVGLPLDPKSSFPIVQKALLPKAPKGKQRKAPAAPPPVAVHRPAPPKPPPRPRPPLLTTMPTMIISAAERAETAAVMGWLAMVGSVDATWSSPDGAIRGYTLLMCACECGHEDMVDALLRKGASPDLQDWKGITALMIAAGKGRGETVVRLLRGGASWELRAPKLGTAAEIAMGKGYLMIPELIRAHEATAAGELDAWLHLTRWLLSPEIPSHPMAHLLPDGCSRPMAPSA